MPDRFAYRPKFVDIRVKKPGAAKPVYGAEEPSPSDHRCDHVGCERAGSHLAPKSRDRSGEFWHFCREHVTDYNKRWNYFAGMSEGEFADYKAKEEVGHRPTWTFRGGRLDRAAANTKGFKGGQASDPFGMFGPNEAANAPAQRQQRRLTRLQSTALEDMSLGENATAADIRAKYAELVKRWHPDSNGGDRGAEASLQRVLKAYQTLKAGGLV